MRDRHSKNTSEASGPPRASGPQRVAVVINPVKTNSDKARSIITKECELAGWPEPLFLNTTEDDPGEEMTRQALEHKADVVIACGGDGTVRVVAQGLAGIDVSLGLVPLGTGNLLARNLEMNIDDLDGSIETALFGDERKIDTGSIELELADTGEKSKHTFLVMAGVGFDAKLFGDTREDLKKNVGWLAYGEAGVRHLPGKPTRVGISMDGAPEQQRNIRSVLFGNCGLLPGGIDFIPGAVIDDGIMDVVVMSPRGIFGWLSVASKVIFKHRYPSPTIDFHRAERITVRCTTPLETELDGDPAGTVNALTVEVDRCALTVRVHKKGPEGAQEESFKHAVEESVEAGNP